MNFSINMIFLKCLNVTFIPNSVRSKSSQLNLHFFSFPLIEKHNSFVQTLSTGECSNPECLYLHINPDDKIRECPYYMRGFCRSGPKCRFKHIKKTTVCENYLIGFCPLGPNCKFGQYVSTMIITITHNLLMLKNFNLLFSIKTSLLFFF